MREILPDLNKWLADHERIGVATVTQTWGSSPRGIGSMMAFTSGGKITGSVSGGCVEGAVIETGLEVIENHLPQLLHFGVADETAWTVGLACGGQIDVFVTPLNERLQPTLDAVLKAGNRCCLATVISGPTVYLGREVLVTTDQSSFPSLSTAVEKTLHASALKALADGRSQVIHLETSDKEQLDVFLNVIDPQPTLVVVGGVHTAVALTSLAHTMGFRTVVIDPRRAFGNKDRFPTVDRLIQSWPDDAFNQVQLSEGTAVAILTHDPKIDDPALQICLQSPAFYIGALGSPSTQEKRHQRLFQAGLSRDQIERLHGPIGIKLGAQTPEEIALAIMAEIVAVQRKVLV